MAAGRRVVTVGGKGNSLTASSVFEVANGLSRFDIESSVRSRISSSSKSNSTETTKYALPIPDYMSSEEVRASLLLLLNKLVLSLSPAAFKLPKILEDTSLRPDYTIDSVSYYTIDNVSNDDAVLLDFSMAAIDGISAILDYRSSALLAVADAVAALSCEALKADVSCFNLIDSGDGSSAKDDVAVASDLKVFLNGSKLVNSGKKPMEPAVARISSAHGIFRESLRWLHSRSRVQLNSGSRASSSSSADAISPVLLSLARALRNLGALSFQRANLVGHSVSSGEFSSCLMEMLNAKCPHVDSLEKSFMSAQAALCKEDYSLFLHEIYGLSEMVRKIVSWEATAAFILLEENELLKKIKLNNGSEGVPSSENNAKTDKKSEKKNKVVLGKGSTALMQLINSLLSGALGPDLVNASMVLEKCSQNFLSLLDPRDLGFDCLLKKIKEIVESNESRRLPKLPKGTRDFAKEQTAIRENAFSTIVDVFKRHGARALDTPAFELRETLMGKYGEDSKLIYDLADQGGELCSLRYDLTVPFARHVAMNGLTSFKRYQIAKVYRRDNPSKGRYREFYQCDFDIAGQFEKMGPDFEVIKILTELLNELDIGDYEVKLNHRKLLDGMLALCGVPQEKFRVICSSIDKLDKQTFEQIKKEMVEDKGLTEETADKIGTFVRERGAPLELLAKLKQEGSKFLDNSESVLALNELEILFKALEASKCINKVVFDLSLARGLDYYTGVIFEAVFKGAAQVGSIAAGGRYDNLIGMFGTKQVPAVGISLGIERVFAIMEQLQKDKDQDIRAAETEVLVCILGDDLSLAAKIVSELWDAQVNAEFSVHKRVMKHIDRARESKIPWMVIVGERELNEGIVKLKDIAASKEYEVPRSRLVEELKGRLNNTLSS